MIIAILLLGLVSIVAVFTWLGRRTGTQNGVSCCAPPPARDQRMINALRDDTATN